MAIFHGVLNPIQFIITKTFLLNGHTKAELNAIQIKVQLNLKKKKRLRIDELNGTA